MSNDFIYSMYSFEENDWLSVVFDLKSDYQSIGLRMRIFENEDKYRSWGNVMIDTGALSVSGYRLLEKATKIAKELNEMLHVNPLIVIETIEKNGFKKAFYSSVHFSDSGYSTVVYGEKDLTKEIFLVYDKKDNYLFPYVGKEKDAEKKLKEKGFSDLAEYGGYRLERHKLDTSDFDRFMQLFLKLKNIKTYYDK